MSTFTTIADLERLTDRELHIMFRTVTQRLAAYEDCAPERREAVATLALIRRVIAQRQGPKPGF